MILANADMLQTRLGTADAGALPLIAAVQRAAEPRERIYVSSE